METVDYAMLAQRVWAGAVMIAHGIHHGRTIPGTTNWFQRVGFRAPRLNALLSAGNELAIGFALLVGLLTPIAAAGLAATMVVAFWSIHRFAGFFVFNRPDEGYEYVVTLAVVALAIAIVGPGAASLDDLIGIDLSGTTGALIYLAGMVAAGLQLAVFWRRPEVTE